MKKLFGVIAVSTLVLAVQQVQVYAHAEMTEFNGGHGKSMTYHYIYDGHDNHNSNTVYHYNNDGHTSHNGNMYYYNNYGHGIHNGHRI